MRGKPAETLEPVWITGIGAATPLGCDIAEIEANLWLAGWAYRW